MKKSRYEKARIILIVQTAFIGIGALGGAIAMFIDPTGQSTGMAGLLPGLNKLPFADVLFKNLIFSGISLLIVNGLSNLTAMFLLLERKHIGVKLGFVFGITLMLWITIQFFIYPFNFLSTSYFILGLLQTIVGYAAIVFYKQEHFGVNMADYPNIGTNDKVIVVYFSRMGYVKKLACEQANTNGGKLLEITSPERTEGTPGFWWCGRFGMHRWDMPINAIDFDFSKYDKVIICTPVWVFSLAAPMRTFCRSARSVKNAEYIICHYSPAFYNNVAREMDKLLGIKAENVTSVICNTGKYKIKNNKK